MAEQEDVLAGLVLELRRGTLVLSVLSLLEGPKYGYSLVQMLEQKGVEIDAGTLYPLLRRLEKQGLLESQWETSGAKPRKYYQRTMQGNKTFTLLKTQWRTLSDSVEALLNGDAVAMQAPEE